MKPFFNSNKQLNETICYVSRNRNVDCLPLIQLHSAILLEIDVHLVSQSQNLRLVTSTSSNALLLGHLVVLHQLILVVRVSAVLDQALSALTRRQSTEIGQTLLGDDHVQIVLGVIDVSSHGHNARDTGGVVLALTGRRSVHDGDVGVTQEIARASQTVDHLGSSHQRRVGVGVHINLHGGVHGDHSQTADDLGEVGDSLGADHAAVLVEVQVAVETLEAIGREGEGDGGGVVQLAGIEEIQHGILEDLRPHLEVLELAAGQSSHHSVGDVAHTGLEGKQVLGETALLDLVGEEVHDVTGNLLGVLIDGGEATAVIGQVALHDGDDLALVEVGEIRTNTVIHTAHQEGAAVRRTRIRHDIVDSAEHGEGSVHLNDELVSEGKHLRGDTNSSSENETAVLSDGSSLHNTNIELTGVGSVILGEETPGKVLSESRKMDITHLNGASVNTLGNILTSLIRPTAINEKTIYPLPRNHTELSPTIFSLSTNGSTSKEFELHLSTFLFNHISKSNGNNLRITGRGETRPTKSHTTLEELVSSFRRSHNLAEEALTSTTTGQTSRHYKVLRTLI